MKEAAAKELVGRVYQMNQSAVECLYLLQNAFLYNSPRSLDECEERTRSIRMGEETLTKGLIEEARANPDVRAYVSVPGHIERMGGFLDDVIRCVRTKIDKGVLFSDKAVSETVFLLERLQEVVKNTGDIILARNTVLKNYVRESATEIGRSASGFATMHEERLIEGLCTPAASPLFLDMLDAMRSIAWHTKEIAEKLTIT
jgi:Na+/phosphate symporter